MSSVDKKQMTEIRLGFDKAFTAAETAYKATIQAAEEARQAAWIEILQRLTQGKSWTVSGDGYHPYRLRWSAESYPLWSGPKGNQLELKLEEGYELTFYFTDNELHAQIRQNRLGERMSDAEAWTEFARVVTELKLGIADPTDTGILHRYRKVQLQKDYTNAKYQAKAAVEKEQRLERELRDLLSKDIPLDALELAHLEASKGAE